MVKKIITNQNDTHDILGTPCISIDMDHKPDMRVLKKIVADLMDTANHNYEICLGLSANQIGHGRRVFVFRTATGPFVPIINPTLVGFRGGFKSGVERCLSRVDEEGVLLPGINVRRSKQVHVEFLDPITQKRERTILKGLTARVFMHELDHLNGRLI